MGITLTLLWGFHMSFHSRLLNLGTVITLSLVLFLISPSEAKRVFPEWNEKVFTEIEKRHGKEASERMWQVYELIKENVNKPAGEQIEIVNEYMNGLTWIADRDLWEKSDYWATPFETLTTFGGDCEDIAIAKYTVLRLLGIADDKLGFVYVVTSNREYHMALAYKESPNKDSLILDNLHQEIVPSAMRKDLVAVYAFKNDGTLFVIKDKGNGQRSVLKKKAGAPLQKWFTAKERARENYKSYLPYNNGNPLLPAWVK